MKIETLHNLNHSKSKLKANIKKNNSKYIVRFTPSIVKVKETTNDVMYLLSFRVWKRLNWLKIPKFPGNRGHPWYNFWKNSQYDGTAFALLKVSKKSFKVNVLKVTIPPINNGLVDMRMIQNPREKSKITIVYNLFGKLNPKSFPREFKELNKTCFHYVNNKDKVHKWPQKKLLKKLGLKDQNLINKFANEEGCDLIMVSDMKMNYKTLMPEYSNIRIVCPKLHFKIEKNHIPFFKNKQMHVMYMLTPLAFFTPKCEKYLPKNSTLFSKMVDYYDNRKVSVFKRFLQISCSTPLVPYGSKELISLGHFKFMMDATDSFPKGSPLDLLIKKLKDIYKIKTFKSTINGNKLKPGVHYYYIYGMFMFTLDKKTLELKRCSNFFILFDGKPNLMVFPAGIEQYKNDFIVSYHESDAEVKLLHLSKSDTRNLLKHTNKTKANKIGFELIEAN